MIRIVLVVAVALVLVMKGQAVPVNSDSTGQKTTISTSDISGLRDNAEVQVYKILQQIRSLEKVKVRSYTHLHTNTSYSLIIVLSLCLYCFYRTKHMTCFTKSATHATTQCVKL